MRDAARGRFAMEHGWPDSAAGWFTDDVVYLHPGAPLLVGREALATLAALTRGPAEGTTFWQPLSVGISRDGTVGYTYGIRVSALADSTGRARGTIGRYLAFWRRAPGTPWRVAAYADLTGAPLAPVAAQGLVTPRPSLLRTHGERAELALRRMRETDSLFSVQADLDGVAVAFGAHVADDGVTFDGPLLSIGPRNVRAEFEEAARRDGASSLTWTPVYADVAESGDLGFTVGDYVRTGRGPTGAAVQRFGKYLTVWRLQPDGRWRFVADGGNGGPAPGVASSP